MRLSSVYITALAIAAITTFSTRAIAGSPDECRWRADMMHSVAQERDKGASSAAIKRGIQQALKKKNRSLEELIDIVYGDLKNLSPKQVAAAVEYVCLRE